MRLDKFLSHATGYSRSECRKLLKNRVVTVNSLTVKQADYSVANTDQIALQGESLSLPQPRYFMLHKPQGYVCANTDAEHPTVLDLLPNELHTLNLAGRLDIDSTGLVLLSDNGEWIHRVTAPNKECNKQYEIVTAAPIDDETVTAFAQGILLHNEIKPTKPAQVERLGDCTAKVTISEGRYHQIKRMFAACGNHVEQLHRVKVGAVSLDTDLLPGQYRPLTSSEVDSFNR